MFLKQKSGSNQKKLTYVNKTKYTKLSEAKKIAVLMNFKNRGKLRPILAAHLSKLPFENFSTSMDNLLKLGEKLFEVDNRASLVK